MRKHWKSIRPERLALCERLRRRRSRVALRRWSRSPTSRRLLGSSDAVAGERSTGRAMSERLRRRQRESGRCGCVARLAPALIVSLLVVVADVPCHSITTSTHCRPEASARTHDRRRSRVALRCRRSVSVGCGPWTAACRVTEWQLQARSQRRCANPAAWFQASGEVFFVMMTGWMGPHCARLCLKARQLLGMQALVRDDALRCALSAYCQPK